MDGGDVGGDVGRFVIVVFLKLVVFLRVLIFLNKLNLYLVHTFHDDFILFH